MAEGAVFTGLSFACPPGPAVFTWPSSSEDEEDADEEEEDEEEVSLSPSLSLLSSLLLLSLFIWATFVFSFSCTFSLLGGLLVLSWLCSLPGLLLLSAGLELPFLTSADGCSSSPLCLLPS